MYRARAINDSTYRKTRGGKPSYLRTCPRSGPGPLAGTYIVDGEPVFMEMRTIGDPIGGFVKELQTGLVVLKRFANKPVISREPGFLSTVRRNRTVIRDLI